MSKEELIKLAEEKGFNSKLILYPSNQNYSHYYLWMCELQKWLRDEKGVYAYEDFETQEVVIVDYNFPDGKLLLRQDAYDFCPDYESHEEVQDLLLLEALKTMK